MKVLFVFVALFMFARAEPFTVDVQLGNQPFDEIRDAELWMYLALSYGESTEFLVSTGDLLPSKNFTRHLNIDFDPTEIAKATFHWKQPKRITNTTSQPSPKFSRNPVVVLDHVMITGYVELRWEPRRDITMKLIPINKDQAIGYKEKAELKVDYIKE